MAKKPLSGLDQFFQIFDIGNIKNIQSRNVYNLVYNIRNNIKFRPNITHEY